MAPESVDIAYVELNRDDLAAEVDITEEELLEYYEDSKSRYLQEEQRQARHILIPFGDDEDAALEQATALTARWWKLEFPLELWLIVRVKRSHSSRLLASAFAPAAVIL